MNIIIFKYFQALHPLVEILSIFHDKLKCYFFQEAFSDPSAGTGPSPVSHSTSCFLHSVLYYSRLSALVTLTRNLVDGNSPIESLDLFQHLIPCSKYMLNKYLFNWTKLTNQKRTSAFFYSLRAIWRSIANLRSLLKTLH